MSPQIVAIHTEERSEKTLDLSLPGIYAQTREVPGGIYTLVEIENLGRHSLGGPPQVTTLTYGPDNPFPETEEALWERIIAIHREDLASYRVGD